MTEAITPYVRTLLRDKYFAARPDLYLGESLWSKFEHLSQRLHPMGDLWEASYSHYYGDDSMAGRTWGMTRRGEQGSLAAIRINRARRNSKSRQALIMAGVIRPKARAANNDAESAYARDLAELILDYDFKAGGLEQLWQQWVEQTEVFGDAYTFTRWVPWKGPQVGVANGRIVYGGDLETTLVPPWLHEFDESYPTADASPWRFVRTYEPKTELVMNYTRLLDGREGDQVADAIWDARGDARLERMSRVAAAAHDTACVINFVHDPCSVLPLGLFVRMLDGDIVLERRPLIGAGGDYDETTPRPVIRLSADEMADTPHAWAPFWNVLAAQELSDSLLTSHATLVTSYTDPIYAVGANTANDPAKLSSGPGRRWTQGVGDPIPTLLERPEVKESAMKFDEMIAGEMEQDMSINSAVTGQSDGKEKNAQYEALRASQAVQQVSSDAKASRAALSKLFELRLKTLRKNAQGDRIHRIVGKAKQHLIFDSKTYNAKQLSPFEGVELEDGNPMEATPQGRWAIVELRKSMGLIKSNEDLDTVLVTGRLDPVVDPVHDENMLIKAENDAIRRGEPPKVFVTQNHVLHMRQHMCTTMSPAQLQDAKVLGTWQGHNDEHYGQYFGLPPGMQMQQDPLFHARWQFIMGLGPEPMAPPPGMPPPGAPPPGAKPGGKPPPAGGPPSMPPNGPAATSSRRTTRSTAHPSATPHRP